MTLDYRYLKSIMVRGRRLGEPTAGSILLGSDDEIVIISNPALARKPQAFIRGSAGWFHHGTIMTGTIKDLARLKSSRVHIFEN